MMKVEREQRIIGCRPEDSIADGGEGGENYGVRGVSGTYDEKNTLRGEL